MKACVENLKGITYIYEHVGRVIICKRDNIKYLEIEYRFKSEVVWIPLKEVRMCRMVDMETFREWFRYEK